MPSAGISMENNEEKDRNFLFNLICGSSQAVFGSQEQLSDIYLIVQCSDLMCGTAQDR